MTNWGFRRVPWCERSGPRASSSATADSQLPRSLTSSSAPYIYGHIRQCKQLSLSFQLTLHNSSLSKQSSNTQIKFCSISNCSRRPAISMLNCVLIMLPSFTFTTTVWDSATREAQSYISIHSVAVSKVTSLKTTLLFLHTTFSQLPPPSPNIPASSKTVAPLLHYYYYYIITELTHNCYEIIHNHLTSSFFSNIDDQK